MRHVKKMMQTNSVTLNIDFNKIDGHSHFQTIIISLKIRTMFKIEGLFSISKIYYIIFFFSIL